MPTLRIQGNNSVIHKNAKADGNHDPDNRRRNPLACEMCYKKKIKCEIEGLNTTCVHCMRRNISCKFVPRKEKRINLKRSRYVKSLEERLRKTESLLRAAGLLHDDLVDHDDIGDDEEEYLEGESDVENQEDEALIGLQDEPGRPNFEEFNLGRNRVSVEQNSIPNVANYSAHSSRPSLDSTSSSDSYERRRSLPGKNVSQAASGFKSGVRENSQFYGRSSPLSILTREGIEWIKSKSGEAKFLEIFLSNSKFDSPWDYWRPDVFHDVFSSKVFKPLPPRAEVFSLLRDYFRTINRIFPLYHEGTFMELVEWQYTQQTCDDSARWASINIILSLAYEYRFSNSQKPDKDREKAWLYYKNAFSVFAELSLRRTDLLSVQALLGMALFLRGNSGTQSTVPIVTAAIRSSHRMGLHRDIPRPGISEVEQEQRRRVFWIAYILDQSTCMRLGNAPAQHFDDFDIDFPSNEADDGVVMADQKPFFRQLCRISMIKSRIYGRLYSAKALEHKSAAEICELIRELHAELENWKGTSRFDTLLKKRGMGDDFLVGFASAGLQLVYYNSLIMIHRLPLMLNFAYKIRLDKGEPIHLDANLMLNQSSASAAVCVQAARDTLKLVNNLPWGDIAWIWSLLYYVFLAVMTIFTNLLRNSQQLTAKDDLQSLNMASTFFATLVPADGPCNYARFMTRMSSTFERIARAVVDRDQKPIRPISVMNDKAETRLPFSAMSHQNVHNRRDHELPQAANYSPSTPSSLEHSASTSVDIPNLDGLPPINSYGYVVLESPSETPPGNLPPQSATSNPSPSMPAELDHHLRTAQHPPPPPSETEPMGQYQSRNNQQTGNPFVLENMAFPFSHQDGLTFPQPDLWQVPLTADWEFGSQFLGSMLGHPDNSGFQGPNLFFFQGSNSEPMVPTATTTTAGIPLTPLNSSQGGYRYGPQGDFVQSSNPGATIWMDGDFSNHS